MLLPDLFDQFSTDSADPGDKDIYLLLAIGEKLFVQSVYCFSNIVGINDHRDIALGRTLGDRVNIDTVVPERGEHLAAHACMGLHVVTDQCEDRETVLDLEWFDLADAYLVLEFRVDRSLCKVGNLVLDRHADRMFRRTLSNENDVYPGTGKSIEKAF